MRVVIQIGGKDLSFLFLEINSFKATLEPNFSENLRLRTLLELEISKMQFIGLSSKATKLYVTNHIWPASLWLYKPGGRPKVISR